MTSVNIDELIRQAQAAEEPGTVRKGQSVDMGGEDVALPANVSSIESAGYSYIYDTRTGAPSLTNNNMLRQQLGKTRDDGSKVFTTLDPGIRPPRGKLRCPLHAESENRAHYDSLGLPVCKKSNIPTPYAVDRHMRNRHPDEWQILEFEKKQKVDEERRQFQEAVFGKMIPAAMDTPPTPTVQGPVDDTKPPLYVSNKDKAKKK